MEVQKRQEEVAGAPDGVSDKVALQKVSELIMELNENLTQVCQCRPGRDLAWALNHLEKGSEVYHVVLACRSTPSILSCRLSRKTESPKKRKMGRSLIRQGLS